MEDRAPVLSSDRRLSRLSALSSTNAGGARRGPVALAMEHRERAEPGCQGAAPRFPRRGARNRAAIRAAADAREVALPSSADRAPTPRTRRSAQCRDQTRGARDRRRPRPRPRRGRARGARVLKDNIATGDRMAKPRARWRRRHRRPRDAHLVTRLRAAGADDLGKTNLSGVGKHPLDAVDSGWSARPAA